MRKEKWAGQGFKDNKKKKKRVPQPSRFPDLTPRVHSDTIEKCVSRIRVFYWNSVVTCIWEDLLTFKKQTTGRIEAKKKKKSFHDFLKFLCSQKSLETKLGESTNAKGPWDCFPLGWANLLIRSRYLENLIYSEICSSHDFLQLHEEIQKYFTNSFPFEHTWIILYTLQVKSIESSHEPHHVAFFCKYTFTTGDLRLHCNTVKRITANVYWALLKS